MKLKFEKIVVSNHISKTHKKIEIWKDGGFKSLINLIMIDDSARCLLVFIKTSKTHNEIEIWKDYGFKSL